MGACIRSVNVLGIGCANHKEAMFEALDNKKVKFLTNQRDYYPANYQRQGDTKVREGMIYGEIAIESGGIAIESGGMMPNTPSSGFSTIVASRY